VSVPPTVTVPGTLTVTLAADPTAAEADLTGFVVLTSSDQTQTRRIPYWTRIEAPQLGTEPHLTLPRPGVYQGTTVGKPSLVSTYRYPDAPGAVGIPNDLHGPEQVWRVNLRGLVANFGVVIIDHTPGAKIQPRIVAAGDENRLTGYTALPIDLNPYRRSFDQLVPVVGDILPKPGAYDIVFDTVSAAAAGAFTFRFWTNDTTPPTARLATPVVTRNGVLRVTVADAGSGVDPGSFSARIDGKARNVRWSGATGTALVSVGALRPGPHALKLEVADYQETKNSEDVARILPNTRKLETSFRVR
jgi:hypothetical protein